MASVSDISCGLKLDINIDYEWRTFTVRIATLSCCDLVPRPAYMRPQMLPKEKYTTTFTESTLVELFIYIEEGIYAKTLYK